MRAADILEYIDNSNSLRRVEVAIDALIAVGVVSELGSQQKISEATKCLQDAHTALCEKLREASEKMEKSDGIDWDL